MTRRKTEAVLPGTDDGPAWLRSRAATAARDLHPGYFAFVMATGIVSAGTFLLGPSWLSRALLAVASAGLVVLTAALAIRVAFFRSSLAPTSRPPTGCSGSSRSPPASTCSACV